MPYLDFRHRKKPVQDSQDLVLRVLTQLLGDNIILSAAFFLGTILTPLSNIADKVLSKCNIDRCFKSILFTSPK